MIKAYMKKLLAAMMAILILPVLTACGSSNAGEGDGLTKITVSLDWTPNTNHTGLYVAQAMGYFEEAGLSVSLVQPLEDGAEALCAAGQAEFAVSYQDTLAAAFALDEPLGVTAIAALLQHNTSGIISRAGEGMNTPSGLENHTYSTWNGAIELAMLQQVVEDDGGDFSLVTLIPNNSITDEAAALAENQTDAIWVYYGWGGINAQLSGLEFDYFYFSDINEVFDYYSPVLIANDDFLSEHPDTARNFLEAVQKGYEYAVQNPKEAAQMLIDGDSTGSLTGSEELVYASQEWISQQYKAEVEHWGYIDASRWNAFYNWLNENELVANVIPDGTGFSNDYLPG